MIPVRLKVAGEFWTASGDKPLSPGKAGDFSLFRKFELYLIWAEYIFSVTFP